MLIRDVTKKAVFVIYERPYEGTVYNTIPSDTGLHDTMIVSLENIYYRIFIQKVFKYEDDRYLVLHDNGELTEVTYKEKQEGKEA